MNARFIRYTQSGQIFIAPEDDPDWIVDVMLETGYDDEFCYALDFDPAFIAALMKAGFLVMSAAIEPACGPDGRLYRYLLLPKLHLERSALFWEDLHESGTARRLLKRYDLRYDADFDRILDRCVQVHGGDWLTPPLLQSIRGVRAGKGGGTGPLGPRPVSFALYRDGELAAGEFGVVTGRVYTSYSGYRDEDSSGTVQMILTGRYLRDAGFAFWDLGMPLDYKDRLGARNISPRLFVDLFRKALVTANKVW